MTPRLDRRDRQERDEIVVSGINPVLEAIRATRVLDLRVGPRPGARVEALLQEARRRGLPVRSVPRAELDRLTDGVAHQGIVATSLAPRDVSVEQLVEASTGPPLILVLDGVEDPRNFGAVLRSAEAAGVSGVVRQKRRAAPLGGVVAKASAGALAHVPIASVVNLARALDELKRAGVWTVGLVGGAERCYHDVDLTQPTALVLGSEGQGLRRLVRERCDWLVSIPMQGRVDSLNVSVAAGIALFEVVRQRLVIQERAGS